MTEQTNHPTDRASWLAYRASWRVRYAEASQAVRDGKARLRDEYASGGDGSGSQGRLHHLRRHACWMMLELEEAKRQKEERLRALEAPKAA